MEMERDDPDPFHLSVAQLLASPGERKEVSCQGEIGQVATTAAEVVGEVAKVNLTLEALTSGEVAIYGEVSAQWQGECRRCLEQVRGEVAVKVKEIFEPSPTEGETYKLDEDSVHLREMTREALLLHLPLAPLCSPGCVGPESSSIKLAQEAEQAGHSEQAGQAEHSRQQQKDPRWAALENLEFED